jgi:iron complex transport system substrate-binding protein
MRIVSLLPSATEILFALGFDREIVGVSHECDFPPAAKTKRVVIHSRIPADASPAEIDHLVRGYIGRGESIYAVDAQALEELAPDLIVTQDLCHVCAASPDDLATALSRFAEEPQVLCLNPQDLGDVWRDILWVGEETCRGRAAESLLEGIGAQLGEIDRFVEGVSERPRVAFLEWLDPFYVGGHWVPEMIERAGGKDVFGCARKPSFRVALQDIVEAAPDVLLISPCGYTAKQARDEYRSMSFPDQWGSLPAVRNQRVFALEANSYFARPGPRLATGIEILVKTLHPLAQVSREAERAVLPLFADTTAARAALA